MAAQRPRITVVGLGPGGAAYLTDQVRTLMTNAGQTFLRTARHPGTDGLPAFIAFDHLYESADTFEQVYVAIVDELIAAAIALAPEPIVYAVPGSPLVAERSVELLRIDDRVDLTVVPALSFLDLAWDRLGIDPVRAAVRLVDAEQFGSQIEADGGPYLVAQCWSRPLLSEIKLSRSSDEGDPVPDVVLLHHLGLADEQVVPVGWWDLDRTVTPDHLTSVYIPAGAGSGDSGREMTRLEDLVFTLRNRCPWDQAQTRGSLMPHLLEESYEVLDALRALDAVETGDASGDAAGALEGHLLEELGDLLFQIVFHARLAQETGSFSLADVARNVHDKLVHRHPHVFGEVEAATSQQVIANWEEIKKKEKGRSSVTEGIPTDLPALLLSTKLQRKALSVQLSEGDFGRGASGLLERIAALESSANDPVDGEVVTNPPAAAAQLVGDVLFEVASLSRRLGIDPELALRTHALAFRDRLREREREASGVRLPDAGTH